MFGASRLIAVIAKDGFLPKRLSKIIKGYIPKNAIITMSLFAFVLIISGGLQIILEFGSITFIIESFLMAYSNFKKRNETKTQVLLAIIAMVGLLTGGLLIFYFIYTETPLQLIHIGSIYSVLIISSYMYSKRKKDCLTMFIIRSTLLCATRPYMKCYGSIKPSFIN